MKKYNKNPLPLLTPAQVGSGQYSGVFIDDTGTPGQDSPSVHLDSDRKTWVAVILNQEQLAEAQERMRDSLIELELFLGVRDLHFADDPSDKGNHPHDPL